MALRIIGKEEYPQLRRCSCLVSNSGKPKTSTTNPAPNDYTLRDHSHDFVELVIIESGSAVHYVDGSPCRVGPGDAFCFKGDQRHHFEDLKELFYHNVAYYPEEIGLSQTELRDVPGYHATFTLEPHFRDRHAFRSRLHLRPAQRSYVTTILQAMMTEQQQSQPGATIALHSWLRILLLYLARQYNDTKSHEGRYLLNFGRAIAELESRPERQWTIDRMAEIACMARRTFQYAFKKALGCSPIEYLLQLQVRHASLLLRTTAHNVTTISHMTGFKDSNYFCRQFKKIADMTPSAYRKTVQESTFR